MERMVSDAFFVLRRSVEVYDEVLSLAQSGDDEAVGMIISFDESLEAFLRAEYEDLKAHVKLLHPTAEEEEVVKVCVKAFSEFVEELKRVYRRIVEVRNSLALARELSEEALEPSEELNTN